jgi:hypothetical protein
MAERVKASASGPEDIGPWCVALRTLLADEATYQRHSTAARRAASQFVATLSAAPLEELLERWSIAH